MDAREILADHDALGHSAMIADLDSKIEEAYSWPWSGGAGDGWIEWPEGDDGYIFNETMQDYVTHAEGLLGEVDAQVWWEDGYIISRMSEDCPLRN